MKIELAHRIRELPPYLFARIDALKNEERKKGKDLIDLGIGDPDLPTPAHIIAALTEAARDASAIFSTMCAGVGRSGLPMPRSMMSSPARRADFIRSITSARMYGGSRLSLSKWWWMRSVIPENP